MMKNLDEILRSFFYSGRDFFRMTSREIIISSPLRVANAGVGLY
jgi:hypothetical protein